MENTLGARLDDGWEPRKDLDFDIPAHGHVEMGLPVTFKPDDAGKSLQISMVQDGVFWAHDIGVKPLTVPDE